MSQSSDHHRHLAQDECAVCAVLTVSDTRTKADDTSGRRDYGMPGAGRP